MSLCAITSLIGVIITSLVQLFKDHDLEWGWPLVSGWELLGFSLLGGALSGICHYSSPLFYFRTDHFNWKPGGMFLMFTGLYFVLWAKGKEVYAVRDGLVTEFDPEKPLLKLDVEAESWYSEFRLYIGDDNRNSSVTMGKHKCKLCARTFSNGRALGGHMKGHLAIHPLPQKTTTHQHQHGDSTDSYSSSSSSTGQEQEPREEKIRVLEEKCLVYGLRENPKKSLRFADPEFSFAVDSDEIKKAELLRKPSLVESPTEPEPVSSVSDTSPEQHVALSLMMLSRDVWKSKNVEQKPVQESSKIRFDVRNVRKRFDLITLDEHKGFALTTAGYSSAHCAIECRFRTSIGGHKRSHLLAAAIQTNLTTI
ncbi:RGPR-related, putative isoform 1 [Hibiscus syriacus]|uniref:RGPR-related, putative isoform 1 n=1 Tax=Hibiscus syriacus TaxID=106335 RepID=A0A6A3AVG9_HIBSY|nr:RGPR-related, putative isoform 1 [Hibiscus syriacus]